MQIISKIDQLISNLNDLKPELLNDPEADQKKFNNLLKSVLEPTDRNIDGIMGYSDKTNSLVSEVMPSWVDLNYGYDPENPRKPNMREFMQAITGKTVEAIYADGNWQEFSSQASDILTGVVGSGRDERDWTLIMSSEDIIKTAQEQTGIMHEPKLEILSNFDETNTLIDQTAVIKDKKGNFLRSLSNDISLADRTLQNFGATNASIPADLKDRIIQDKFNANLFAFLKDFDRQDKDLEEIAFQTTTEVISKKLSKEVPLEEIEKL